MVPHRRNTSIAVLFTALSFSISNSQHKPVGDPAEMRNAILSSNNITTVMYNYGQYARPNTLSGVADFVWKRLGYMLEFGPLFAAKVVNDHGDALRIVDDGCWLPPQGDYSPDGTLKWGWLPRGGYARSGQPNLATSNNPGSWPATWSAWPGEFGNGVIVGQNEAYYAMDDFTNAEFSYYPFPSDSTKRGLGVSAEVRTYQFGGNLADAIIVKWKLKNESPKLLNECYFGFYGDPQIGGSSDFADDRVFFVGPNGPPGDPAHYLARNTIYNWDEDGRGTGGLPTGYLSFKFLRTPNSLDLTSFTALPYTNSLPNVPKNDPLMWQVLSSFPDSSQELFLTPGDNVLVFGTGPFSLAAGDSTNVSLAIFLSDNYQDMLDDATYIHFAANWPNIGSNAAQQGGDPNYAINLTSPNSGVFNGSIPVTWQYTGTDPDAKVLIEYSWDRGKSWKPLVWDHPVYQPFTWNTANGRDGVNYLMRIVAYSADLNHYFYDISNQRFAVNNPANARPELEVNFSSFEGGAVRQPPLNISWTSEDADNPTLMVSLFAAYNESGPWFLLHSGSYASGAQIYAWDFSSFPNASSCFVKVVASDGTADSTLISQSFSINQEIAHYQQNAFQHVAGKGTPDLALQVVNPSQVTGHTYEVTFGVVDTTKHVSVRDLTTGLIVVNNYLLVRGMSTPLFHGLKLTVNDKQTDINRTQSKFNRFPLDSAVNFNWTRVLPTIPQTRVPLDWFIAFNSLDTLPNGHYIYPGDTVLNNNGRRVVVCPFHIQNIDSMQAGYGFVNGALTDSMWRSGRELLLRPQPPVGVQMSYQVNMNFTPTLHPTFGDTLWIITDKPITALDVFRFVADSNYVTGVVSRSEVARYELSNNYPNPFNPTTTIKYQLPTINHVTLKVFDILGREVATLVNEVQDAGFKSVNFEASILASGVYLYRLQAGGFVETKKMLLVR